MRRPATVLLLVACCIRSAPALAEDKAAADAAFREGKVLLENGETAAACARFEVSLALMVQLGTRLNLADCYERLGNLAAAHDQFRVAELAADIARDNRLQFIRDRIVRLEARLPLLTIALAAGADITDLVIERDGEMVHRDLLAKPVVVDPGPHAVEVSAPGHQAWSVRVQVREGERLTVRVPPLEPIRDTAQAGSTATSGSGARAAVTAHLDDREGNGDPGRTRRLLAIGIGVAGVVAITSGLVFGEQARSKWNEAQEDDHCDDSGACDEMGLPLARDANRAATRATILVSAGVAAVTAGILLYVRAPRRERPSRARLTPMIGPAHAGLDLSWSF